MSCSTHDSVQLYEWASSIFNLHRSTTIACSSYSSNSSSSCIHCQSIRDGFLCSYICSDLNHCQRVGFHLWTCFNIVHHHWRYYSVRYAICFNRAVNVPTDMICSEHYGKQCWRCFNNDCEGTILQSTILSTERLKPACYSKRCS